VPVIGRRQATTSRPGRTGVLEPEVQALARQHERGADEERTDESERAVVYYVALLAWLGCHADSHEQATWFGDDTAAREES
jgi:hypothetical protein